MSLTSTAVATPARAEQQARAQHTVTYDQYSVRVDGEPFLKTERE